MSENKTIDKEKVENIAAQFELDGKNNQDDNFENIMEYLSFNKEEIVYLSMCGKI